MEQGSTTAAVDEPAEEVASARPEPFVLVLFGGTGDLAARKVLPALATLHREGLLPGEWRLVASSRRDGSDDAYRETVREALAEFGPSPDDDAGAFDELASRIRFAGGGFDADDPGELLDVLDAAREDLGGDPHVVFYLATPPGSFEPYTRALSAHGRAAGARVVYEKPFGTSSESFRELDAVVSDVLEESQVFRIDHFLGKEATQSVHVVRFANGLFSHSWDSEHIESVQVDVPETLDVAGRAGFYDGTGAALDMMVTHLFQLVAEVAMEPPESFAPDDIASARERVIGCFRPLDPADVVLGQYEGYRELDDVPDDSVTDTFVAARLYVDNDRWRGVPFLLRSGKALAESGQRVTVLFRPPDTTVDGDEPGPQVLTFDLKDSAISLSLAAKRPGPQLRLGRAEVALPLGETFSASVLEAYARLLLDVLAGDRTLFTRPDGLAHAWAVAQPLLDHRPEPVPYARGSWGPQAATALAGDRGWALGPATSTGGR